MCVGDIDVVVQVARNGMPHRASNVLERLRPIGEHAAKLGRGLMVCHFNNTVFTGIQVVRQLLVQVTPFRCILLEVMAHCHNLLLEFLQVVDDVLELMLVELLLPGPVALRSAPPWFQPRRPQ